MKSDQNCKSNNNRHSGKEVLRKGPWMPEEDEILIEYVRQYGARDWNSIGAKGLLPRTGKSCRLRWVNKLKPDLKRSGCKFSPEEEKTVMEMQATLGNKWAKIASYLPGRTDNDVKNFWSTRQKRMMRALQSPRGISTNTNTVQNHATDMNQTNYLTDISAYEQQQQATGFGGTPFNTTFPDEATDPFERDQSLEVRKVRQKTLPFSNELDDSLMVKLQDLVAGESDSLFVDNHNLNAGATTTIVAEDSSEGSAMSTTLNNNTINNNYRSSRPHSKHSRQGELTCTKREIMSINNSLVPFQSENFKHMENYDQLHELSLTQDSTCDFEVDLFIDANDSNILDFLLQPEEDATSSAHNSSTMFFNQHQQIALNQDQTDNNFTASNNNSQWDKMPEFYPGDIQISEYGIKEEVDSCTPDSIWQVGFATDVFEALEPLSPNASIWWDSKWI